MIRRGGLLGMAARTAVVAGTATAVSGGVRRRQMSREQEAADAAAYQQAQQQAAAPPQAAPAGGTDVVTELKKLADLKAAGALTDDEFVAAKAKLLG